MIVSRDGLVLSAHLAAGQDEEMLAAVGATIFGTLDRSIQKMGLGGVMDSIVETTSHSLQMLGVGNLVVLVIADKRMNVAEVRREMRRLAAELTERGLVS